MERDSMIRTVVFSALILLLTSVALISPAAPGNREGDPTEDNAPNEVGLPPTDTSDVTRSITREVEAPISSVDPISPYWRSDNPLTITATADDTDSGVENVSLWYRYSRDDVHWDLPWSLYGDDDSGPWSWSFNFPGSVGHYRFRTTAADLAGNVESAPGEADAECGYDPDRYSPDKNNSSPTLFWTLEENYQNNGVHPTAGVSSDEYEFRIRYADPDDDDPRVPPGHIRLILDGEEYDMRTVDGYFPDGAIFTTNISGLAPAEHHYYFESSDGYHTVRFPESSDLSLPVINLPPELIVPFHTEIGGNQHKGTVFPVIANATDMFTFQIIYKDVDGQPPLSAKDSRGVYIDNVFHGMEPQQGFGPYYDGMYENGEMFEFRSTLPVGDFHSYYFEFTDEMGATNHTATFEGPVVVPGFPDLRIGTDLDEALIDGTPVSREPSVWYDMTISAVIENPSDYSVNRPFSVEFNISHADRESGDFSQVDLFTTSVFRMYGHSERSVEIPFTALEVGVYKVEVIVDSGREIVEILDNDDKATNNRATGTFTVGPDLRILSEHIQPPGAYVGREINLSAKIYNVGRTIAYFDIFQPLTVSFNIGDRTFFDEITEPIFPDDFVVAQVRYVSLTPSVNVLKVRVDTEENLEEVADFGTYNNNNYDFKKLTVIERVSELPTPSFGPPATLIIPLLGILAVLTRRASRKG